VDQFYPEIGLAMVEIFSALGYPVIYPFDQTCCGQWAYNSGDFREAKKLAQRFVELFDPEIPIISPSGSCVYMVKHHYLTLLQDTPALAEKARRISANIHECTQFLYQREARVPWRGKTKGLVTYHESCHLKRGLGISEEPRGLLKLAKGLELVEMEEADQCCGFGGQFWWKFPGISRAILENKVERILASGARMVAGADAGCLLNIESLLKKKDPDFGIYHILELVRPDGNKD
jgi:L-lactate dehydrogenase complex protein LldE